MCCFRHCIGHSVSLSYYSVLSFSSNSMYGGIMCNQVENLPSKGSSSRINRVTRTLKPTPKPTEVVTTVKATKGTMQQVPKPNPPTGGGQPRKGEASRKK